MYVNNTHVFNKYKDQIDIAIIKKTRRFYFL